MKALELFCGLGVSSCGVIAAGADLLLAADNCAAAVRAFNGSALLPSVAQMVDLQALPSDSPLLAGAEVWCAGPPCQPFSQGSTLFGRGGPDDPRNGFPTLLRLVTAHRPRYLLIENTMGLRQFRGYLSQLHSALEALGYTVTVEEVDCYDFGVPQHRKRVVVLAAQGERWRVRRPARRPASPATVGECLHPPPAGDEWDLLLPLSDKAIDYWTRDPRHAQKHPPLKAEAPASTVVANYARGVPYGVVSHEGKLWTCGPRLAARLQGVPDTYRLHGARVPLLRGIGNGFPAPVVTHLLRELL